MEITGIEGKVAKTTWWVADRAVKTQCLRPTCLQVGRGLRIAAREQNNVMSECNQFVGQPRNNALGASIKLRRDCLSQRGYLRDLHAQSCLETRLGFASRAGPDRTARCGHRANLDLGSARPALPRARSVSCPVLNQSVFRLK